MIQCINNQYCTNIITIYNIYIYTYFFLQVAEQLINPFGDDEEDFELNYLIDRHTKVNQHIKLTTIS